MNNDRFRFRVWCEADREMTYPDSPDIDGALAASVFLAESLQAIWDNEPDEGMFLMQCTGLKDSEGNLIYESDIVRIRFADERNNYISPVMWKYGAWCIYHENRVDYQTGERACVGFGYWTKEALKGVTLLGNIYQDPSLLEADKK